MLRILYVDLIEHPAQTAKAFFGGGAAAGASTKRSEISQKKLKLVSASARGKFSLIFPQQLPQISTEDCLHRLGVHADFGKRLDLIVENTLHPAARKPR